MFFKFDSYQYLSFRSLLFFIVIKQKQYQIKGDVAYLSGFWIFMKPWLGPSRFMTGNN